MRASVFQVADVVVDGEFAALDLQGFEEKAQFSFAVRHAGHYQLCWKGGVEESSDLNAPLISVGGLSFLPLPVVQGMQMETGAGVMCQLNNAEFFQCVFLLLVFERRGFDAARQCNGG